MSTVHDRDGNEWAAAGVNAFQQRQLRCVAGPREGDVILDPRAPGRPDPRPPREPRLDPWTAGLFTSDFFDRAVIFGVMPTFHCVTLLLTAHKAACRAADDSARPKALTEDALAAIIMAATATEAFINELADYLQRVSALSDIAPSLKSCADLVGEIEDAHGSVKLKYHVASLALSGSTFDTGMLPFQDFAELIRLRNAIVHLKPDDTSGPKVTDALAQRDLALSENGTSGLPWLDRLLTPETAKWGVQAAHNVMLAVLEMANKQCDPYLLANLNQGLRDNPAFAVV